jgi:ADP-heptose:LPS heptosyltransferase
MSRKPKNALNRLIKISTNFLYNCFYSSILRVKNYNYYISLHAEMPRQFVRMFNFIFKSKPYFFKFDTFLDYLKINSYYGNLPSLNFVSSHNFDKKTIGLYVAASSFQKIWHPRYWADLIRYIKHKYKDEYTINIYGNGKIAIDIYSSIMFYLDELKLYPNIDFFNCINKNSIELDLQHCKGLELAISNDSGFLWVANCFKIKNIAILGFEDGKRYSDLFKNSNFIYINSQLPCAPCNKYAKIIDIEIKCPYRVEDGKISFYKCSTESRAPQVYQAIDDLLARPSVI